MKIDLIAFGLVALFGLSGLLRGGIREASGLVALALGAIGAAWMARLFGPAVSSRAGLPPLIGTLVAGGGGFLVLYIVLGILARALLHRVFPGRQRGLPERLVGATLGAAKGFALSFGVISALVLFEKPIAGLKVPWRYQTKGSWLARLASTSNPFALLHAGELKGIAALIPPRAAPAAPRRLQEGSEIQAVAADPRMQAIAADPALAEALKRGDYLSALRSPKTLEILKDPAFLQRVLKAGASLPPDLGSP